MESICRVCGLDYGPDHPTWYSIREASFDICVCCGVQFGYLDTSIETVREFRQEWISNGAKWQDHKACPKEWNVFEQMKAIPIEWF